MKDNIYFTIPIGVYKDCSHQKLWQQIEHVLDLLDLSGCKKFIVCHRRDINKDNKIIQLYDVKCLVPNQNWNINLPESLDNFVGFWHCQGTGNMKGFIMTTEVEFNAKYVRPWETMAELNTKSDSLNKVALSFDEELFEELASLAGVSQPEKVEEKPRWTNYWMNQRS